MRFVRWSLILILISLAVWRLAPELKDFYQIIKIVKNAKIIWLILAVIAIIGQYFGDGWLSQILLKIIGVSVNLKNNLKIAVMDVFAAHLLPLGEAGVIATSFYFYQKIGVDPSSVIFLSFFWALLTSLVMFFLLLVSILLLPKPPIFSVHLSEIAKYTFVIILVAAPLIFIKRKMLWTKAKKIFSKYTWFRPILSFVQNLTHYKNSLLQNKHLLTLALLAAFIYYAGNIASLNFSFLAYGQSPHWAVITFAYIMSLITSFITLTPAGIGTSEATLILIFLQFGQDPTQTLAAVLTFRLIASWSPVPIGFLVYRSMMKEKRISSKIGS